MTTTTTTTTTRPRPPNLILSSSPTSPSCVPSIVMTHPDCPESEAVLLLSPNPSSTKFPSPTTHTKRRLPFAHPSTPTFSPKSMVGYQPCPTGKEIAYAHPNFPYANTTSSASSQSACLTLSSALRAIRGVLCVAITVGLIIVMFAGMAAATSEGGMNGLQQVGEWWSVKGLLKYGKEVEAAWRKEQDKVKLAWTLDQAEETQDAGDAPVAKEPNTDSAVASDKVVETAVVRATTRMARQRRVRQARSPASSSDSTISGSKGAEVAGVPWRSWR